MSLERLKKALILILIFGSIQLCQAIDSLRLHKLELASKVWGVTILKSEKKIKNPDKELLNLVIETKNEESYIDYQVKTFTWCKKNMKTTSTDCCNCKEVLLSSSFSWISDTVLLGKDLSEYLYLHISKQSKESPQMKLASTIPTLYEVKGKDKSETSLTNNDYLVAAIKYWNLVNYIYPYSNDQNIGWSNSLGGILSTFDTITSLESYYYTLLRTSKRLQDGHARIYSSFIATNLFKFEIPFNVEVYEHFAVVTQSNSSNKHIQKNDLITAINGIPIENQLAHWDTLLSYSTRGWFLHTVRNYLFASKDSILSLTIRRGEEVIEKEIPLVLSSEKPISTSNIVYNMNKDSIGYIHLGNLQLSHISTIKRDLQKAKVLIVDAREYPNSTLIALSSWLLDERKLFARFEIPSKLCFGNLAQDSSSTVLTDLQKYQGTILYVIDRSTISQGEFMTMAFAQSTNVITIGRTTSGSVGTTTLFSLPGNMLCRITASKCTFPNGDKIQQVGIRPTIDLTESTELSTSDDLIKFAYEYALRLIQNSNKR